MPTGRDILTSARGTRLAWSQCRAFAREYELTADERRLAELRFPRAFGSLAEARIGDEAWTFKRVGFWHPAVTIRSAESGDRDLGRFAMHWRGGELFLPDGPRYGWGPTSFWRAEWAFQDVGGGTRLVEFRPRARLLKVAFEVDVRTDGEGSRDLPLLVMLGGYLLVMASEDEAAAVAGSTAAIG